MPASLSRDLREGVFAAVEGRLPDSNVLIGRGRPNALLVIDLR